MTIGMPALIVITVMEVVGFLTRLGLTMALTLMMTMMMTMMLVVMLMFLGMLNESIAGDVLLKGPVAAPRWISSPEAEAEVQPFSTDALLRAS